MKNIGHLRKQVAKIYNLQVALKGCTDSRDEDGFRLNLSTLSGVVRDIESEIGSEMKPNGRTIEQQINDSPYKLISMTPGDIMFGPIKICHLAVDKEFLSGKLVQFNLTMIPMNPMGPLRTELDLVDGSRHDLVISHDDGCVERYTGCNFVVTGEGIVATSHNWEFHPRVPTVPVRR